VTITTTDRTWGKFQVPRNGTPYISDLQHITLVSPLSLVGGQGRIDTALERIPGTPHGEHHCNVANISAVSSHHGGRGGGAEI
jgi:hypothetical protein